MSKFRPQVADAGQYEGALRQQRITLGGAERSGAIWDAVTAAAASVAGSVPDSFRTDLLEVRALRSGLCEFLLMSFSKEDVETAAAASVDGSVPDSFRADILEVHALRHLLSMSCPE